MDKTKKIAAGRGSEAAYLEAKERYAVLGVDTDHAIDTLTSIPLSIHCWQGDDVVGFDGADKVSGGIMATGSHSGRARNATELRQDLEFAFSLIPGRKRCNLHAMYAETQGKRIDRDALEPEHFANWVDWARGLKMGLDFNPSFFSHPLSESGFTLSHPDTEIRKFWVRHGLACRRIAQSFADEFKDHVFQPSSQFWDKSLSARSLLPSKT